MYRDESLQKFGIHDESFFLFFPDDSDHFPLSSTSPRHFIEGEVVWGPNGVFPSWPGKLLANPDKTTGLAQVCWFGSKDVTEVNAGALKSLSDGLEAHHRERKRLRK